MSRKKSPDVFLDAPIELNETEAFESCHPPRTSSRRSSEDFTNKLRDGVPFEGPHPEDLTEAELLHINTRWEEFFRKKKGLIDYLTDYDEDLSSIAMLGVRRTIALHPDCPDSWLVQRAKYDIKSARYWGSCIDSGTRKNQRDDIGDVAGNDNGSFADRLADFLENKQQYRVLEHQGQTGQSETKAIDKITYNEFFQSLDPMEQKLVEILKDEYRGDWKWFEGEYVKQAEKGNSPKTRFKGEVSKSETDYVVSFAHARTKFYELFGTEEEAQKERKWFRDWTPTVEPLHGNRTGYYERTGKYAKNKK